MFVDMKKVSIIIPTYNEAKNIPFLLEEIFSYIPKEKYTIKIIIVDDNSPDGTGEIAKKLSEKYPLTVIHRSKKLGLGSAVREGFRILECDCVGVMDADLSHDPKILPQLLASLESYDIAIGSRFEPGSEVDNWTWGRKLLSYIGVFLARCITKVKDPLSGYFFLKKSVIDHIELTTVGYKILFEILVKGNYKKVIEIPFHFRSRTYSSSKLNRAEYKYFLKQIFEYMWFTTKR